MVPCAGCQGGGFKVYAVTDASGDPSEFASRTTLECKGGISIRSIPASNRASVVAYVKQSVSRLRFHDRKDDANSRWCPLTKVTENLARRMRRHRPRRLSLRRTRHLSRRPVKLVKVSRQIAAKQLWRTLARLPPALLFGGRKDPRPTFAAASQVDQAG
jgi:hypothetical protein